jgi:hypothetical protein
VFSGIAGDWTDLGTAGVDWGSFAEWGRSGEAELTGTLGCDTIVSGTRCSGTPGADAPGTPGKEKTSFGKLGAVAHGSVLFPPEVPGVWYGVGAIGALGTDAVAAAGEDVAFARSDPLGGAVGGDEGIAGTPGKENISKACGNCGAAAQGPAFSPSRKDKDEAGLGIADGEAEVETSGTSATTPANEAAIARKSASFSAPVGTVEGICGSPGTEPGFGTAEEENISCG